MAGLARAGSPGAGTDPCLAGTRTLSILSPGPRAASGQRFFNARLQQALRDAGLEQPEGLGLSIPGMRGSRGQFVELVSGWCQPGTARTSAARGCRRCASPAEELPSSAHKPSRVETSFARLQRAPGTPAKHIWLKAVGAAPAMRTPVRKRFPPGEIPPSPSGLLSRHHPCPVSGCWAVGSAEGRCPPLVPTSEGRRRDSPAPGLCEGGRRVLSAQASGVERSCVHGCAHRQLRCSQNTPQPHTVQSEQGSSKQPLPAACSKAGNKPRASWEREHLGR